jgi:dihydroxyacetone kinase
MEGRLQSSNAIVGSRLQEQSKTLNLEIRHPAVVRTAKLSVDATTSMCFTEQKKVEEKRLSIGHGVPCYPGATTEIINISRTTVEEESKSLNGGGCRFNHS